MNRKPALLRAQPLPAEARNRWARIVPRLSSASSLILFVTMYDAGGQPVAGPYFLREERRLGLSGQRPRTVIAFVPGDAVELRLQAFGTGAASARVEAVALTSMGRPRASAWLLAGVPAGTVSGLARATSFHPMALLSGIRRMLTALAFEPQVPPRDYATWIGMFDRWEDRTFADEGCPSIAYLVVGRPGTDAMDATLAALAAQRRDVSYRVLDPEAGSAVAEILSGLEADYVGILAAGEVMPPHATLLAADQLRRLGGPSIAVADEDSLGPDGIRHSPLFKPVPNAAMMLSGLLASGLWLVRRTLLADAGGTAGPAEVLRLRSDFARQGMDPRPSAVRIPFILTHRRPDVERADAAALAQPVAVHLARGGPAITPIPAWPVTFRLKDASRPEEAERVTVIVPSTLRRPHSLRCIQAVLEGTDHPAFDLNVVVMQTAPLDATQSAAAAVLERDPRASVIWLRAPRFNFSTANNHVAARTRSDHILLLNDDVTPIRPDWLRWMVAFLGDPATGLVGARLLYPDGRVQHGGVIMGLAGLCEHANRYLPGDDPGYMHRAVVAQRLSAVTAACMLVRRSLYEAVGGLDEGFPSAFNDVDFALRVGETGHAIVYAPQAELHHHELQTYGSHYAGEREPFQAEEVRRMRQRWATVNAEDPFHSPNLSLDPGLEWNLAFPPRVGGEYD